MTAEEMDAATKDLKTKSDKIRVLDRLGASRSQIADYLQIRYQHVRNVLVAPPPARPRAAAVTERGDAAGAVRPLTIEEAKNGLAAHFGVPASAIEITIRG